MERSIYYGQVIHMQFLNTFFHAHLTRLFIARMTHSGLPWPADLYIGQTQPLHYIFLFNFDFGSRSTGQKKNIWKMWFQVDTKCEDHYMA